MSSPVKMSGFMPDFKVANAIRMRGEPTRAEDALIVICKRICLKYCDRIGVQTPMLGYIADVYFHASKVCVEADGGYHCSEEQIEKDKRRDWVLKENGIATIRLLNSLVLNDPKEAQKQIEEVIGRCVGVRHKKKRLTTQERWAKRQEEITNNARKNGLIP